MTLAAAGLLSCTGTGQSAFDPASVADASGEVTRVEPLSWWTGMQTPLQLLVNGAGIAAYDVRIEGGQGVGVKARHKADSPNYLFVDVEVQPDAEPGTYYLVFSQGERQFKVPYEIAARAEGSVARRSFTTADMIYASPTAMRRTTRRPTRGSAPTAAPSSAATGATCRG